MEQLSLANFLDLALELQPLAQKFLSLVNTAIVPSTCRITVTWRSADAQGAAFDKGLSNAKAGQSPHNCTLDGEPNAKAFDFAIFNPDGSYVTDGEDKRYSIAGHIAEGLGLIWGATFSKPDYDHVELSNWHNI